MSALPPTADVNGYGAGRPLLTQRRRKRCAWGGAALREKRAKISANVVRHGRHVTFQLAEEIHGEAKSVAEVRLDGRNYGKIAFQARPTHQNRATGRLRGDNYSIGCAV